MTLESRSEGEDLHVKKHKLAQKNKRSKTHTKKRTESDQAGSRKSITQAEFCDDNEYASILFEGHDEFKEPEEGEIPADEEVSF